MSEKETGNKINQVFLDDDIYLPYHYVLWLKSQFTWKRVEDGLPEDVIGKVMTKDCFFARNEGCIPILAYKKHGVIHDMNGLHTIVSHWLPIPKLNTEEEMRLEYEEQQTKERNSE